MQKKTASDARPPHAYRARTETSLNLTYIMKLSACVCSLLLLSAQLLLATPGNGQKMNEKTISLSLQNEKLATALDKIEKLSGFHLGYSLDAVKNYNNISLTKELRTLEQTLSLILANTRLDFKEQGNNTILVFRKKTPPDTNKEIVRHLSPASNGFISGIVTNKAGYPLAGATVALKGTSISASTDAEGNFTLTAPDGVYTIVTTYIGYETKEQQIRLTGNATANIAIELTTKDGGLDDIVVKGYYNTTKRKSTGSVGTITAEEISKQPVGNPLNALQGRVAGAIVTQSNGLPGSRVSIQIRGQNSLENGTLPMYIIDGVPFNFTTQAVPARDDLNAFGITGANGGVSPFSIINPADIERIDILKDADATSIYGSRGANGVVLITTKKGKAGKTRLDLNVYSGIGKVSRKINMLNTQQYLALRKEAFANDAITPTAANAPDLATWDQNAYTDWQEKYLGGTAGTNDAQATVSGGDTRTRFLLNGAYHRETTVFPGNTGSTRFSGRFNGDHNSRDKKFNINLSINYSSENTNLIRTDASAVYTLPPNMPLYNADGTLYWVSGLTNPESYFLQKYAGKTSNFITNTNIRYTLLPGLDLKTNFGFTRISINQNIQQPASSKTSLSAATNSASFSNITQESFVVEPQLTYNRSIGEGKLSVLAGTSFQRNINDGLSIEADNYSNPAQLGSIAGAGPSPLLNPSYTLYKYTSVFGRAGYEWRGKYILNATVRTDGSSRFGDGRKFGTFGSVGAAWIFSEELAVKKAVPFLSFGKLRASYGTTGNDQFRDYMYMSTLSSASGTYAYQGNSVLFPSRIANPLLAWESTRKVDVGLELGFLENRISLNAGYYRNRSGTQVSTVRVSVVAGTNGYTGNLPAVIQNTGTEIELNTINVKTKNFTWKTALNLTIPRNKFLSVDKTYFNASTAQLGAPVTAVLRYLYKGVNPATGAPLYTAFNGSSTGKDTVTSLPNFSLDRRVIGTSTPDFYGGINNQLSYKNLELSFFFHYTKQQGTVAFSSTPGALANIDASRDNRWTAANPNAPNPKATTVTSIYSNYGSSDATWGNASWLRLRNVSLSYSFNQDWIKKARLENLRVFVQAQNLFVITKVKSAYDPETGTSMPPLRVITAGINCSF